MTAVDIQLSPANCEWAVLRDASLAAEAAGFQALWVFDHLAGVSLGGTTALECFTHLAAIAEATSTIALGTLVANVWNRQIGTLLVAAASIVRISQRPLLLGLGAGTSPVSRWAAEHHAAGADLEPDLHARHRRIVAVLDLTERAWGADRSPEFASFPQPSPPPTTLIGVNSLSLSRIAGARAGGVNVAWNHPRRDELLAAASAAHRGQPFIRTTWTYFDAALLDAEHPVRQDMAAAGIDRVVLTELGDPRQTVAALS